MKITKNVAGQMRQDLNAAMKEFEEKWGVKVNIGNIQYRDSSLKTQLEVSVIEKDIEGQEINLKEKAEFERNCYKYGFKPEDYLKEFKSLYGESFILVGFNTRAPKYPFRIKGMDGRVSRAPFGYLVTEDYELASKFEVTYK